MKKRLVLIFALIAGGSILAQGRYHTAIRAGILNLVSADSRPPVESEVSIFTANEKRVIKSNGIPEHNVGRFPNRGNPNAIRAQANTISIPEHPKVADRITYMHGQRPGPKVFGIALNGVTFEPGAGEFWKGNPSWQYEPLGAAIPLGLDENHAHVQPTGKYHYHGLPTGLMKRLGYREGSHSPLIGWAADGFPIYVRYGYKNPKDPDSEVVDLQPSYQLIAGNRPSEPEGPGGRYDGTFVRDYHYIENSGDLDECNGRFCVTPEFPGGTYAYFMTEKWPVVPRAFQGTPTVIGHPGEGGMRHPPHGKGKGKGKGKGFPPPPGRF